MNRNLLCVYSLLFSGIRFYKCWLLQFFFIILKVLFFILQPAPTQPKRYPFVTKRILLTRDPKDKSIKGQWLNNKGPMWNRKTWTIYDSFCSNCFWNILDYTLLEHFKKCIYFTADFFHASIFVYMFSFISKYQYSELYNWLPQGKPQFHIVWICYDQLNHLNLTPNAIEYSELLLIYGYTFIGTNYPKNN